MKRLVLGSVAVIAIGVSIAAQAADMAVRAPPPATPAAPYNWSGFYIGGNFGGAWTSGNLTIPDDNFYSGLTEFIGGVVVAGLGLSLSFRHRLVEARERRLLGASEADPAVALSVGARAPARAGVDRAASLRRSETARQPIRANSQSWFSPPIMLTAYDWLTSIGLLFQLHDVLGRRTPGKGRDLRFDALFRPRIGFAGQSAAVRRPAKDVYNHVGTAGCNGRGPLRQGGS
jgi:hypothetical protein